ncbi:MAG: hypothetical protein HON53_05660 [Planctomycetaceae bacterium]|jgi:hypothetical protein|nr:hypothetical protein [Planctomycetaceae bacterium]MBT6156373.1 hypothetical protein [Planctomycetaceae bacterium]MBT6488013.1 hypothetical protein [Planctomycetaceae bacterium]MBT6495254.1 hypothetical protein [Planctomycetaceae bacterium]
MSDEPLLQIVPGVHISSAGEVTTSPELHDVLCDVAGELEDDCDLPVDLEHVLAALIMATNAGQISDDRQLASDDSELRALLVPHVRLIFEEFDGQICGEE